VAKYAEYREAVSAGEMTIEEALTKVIEREEAEAARKQTLREMIGGPGGMPAVLCDLSELAREDARNAREVHHDRREAVAWEKIARAIGQAGEKVSQTVQKGFLP
jgi:hypothetical protein